MDVRLFYNHLILSGTKIYCEENSTRDWFYNHLILSGTKIKEHFEVFIFCFTIT